MIKVRCYPTDACDEDRKKLGDEIEAWLTEHVSPIDDTWFWCQTSERFLGISFNEQHSEVAAVFALKFGR